jgi:hypothetical protein
MGRPEDDIGPYSLDAEASPNGSRDQLIVKPIKTWKGYVWDTWELPKDQRWLLFKVDAVVLTFASVSTRFLSLREEYMTELLSSVTFSRISICTMSITPFSAAWRKTSRCTATSS